MPLEKTDSVPQVNGTTLPTRAGLGMIQTHHFV